MKKISFISGSRAEYSLMKPIMLQASQSQIIEQTNIFTGTHFSEKYGLSKKNILDDLLSIDYEVDLAIATDNRQDIADYVSKGIKGFANFFSSYRPDLICILGDRYEILSAAICATVFGIPIAHIHGGEVTQGAIDDAIRHSITKMAHLHFVSTNSHWKRVIQLGESPSKVFNVGAIGIDNIRKLKILKRNQLKQVLGIKNLDNFFVVTFHPATLEHGKNESAMKEILLGISTYPEKSIIFTMPNADTESNKITNLIKEFCKKNINAHFYKNLGQQNYLSCLALADCVIGNSSSGIIEAPSLKTPTVNVGNRQKGRERAKSIIDCSPKSGEIINAINKAISIKYDDNLKVYSNPYDNGGAITKILEILEKVKIDNLLDKEFYDVHFKP